MIADLVTPDTAGVALSLIERFEIAVDDKLSSVLLAKDGKGKSKLLELMVKSEAYEAARPHRRRLDAAVQTDDAGLVHASTRYTRTTT